MWLSKLLQYPNGTADVSYGELQYWALDMFVCANRDPAHELCYGTIYGLANREQVRRLENFISEPSLFYTFLKQDAQDRH